MMQNKLNHETQGATSNSVLKRGLEITDKNASTSSHKSNGSARQRHKNTGKSKQLQRHNRESSSSALPLAISVQTRSSGIAAGRL